MLTQVDNFGDIINEISVTQFFLRYTPRASQSYYSLLVITMEKTMVFFKYWCLLLDIIFILSCSSLHCQITKNTKG